MKKIVMMVGAVVMAVACWARSDVGFGGVYIGDKPGTWSAERMKSLGGHYWGESKLGGKVYKDLWLKAPEGFSSFKCEVDAAGEIVEMELGPELSTNRVAQAAMLDERLSAYVPTIDRSKPENDVAIAIAYEEGWEKTGYYRVRFVKRELYNDFLEGMSNVVKKVTK